MTKSNELRVFISSTFRDLQEEREHLVKKIFPEIRAICRKRGITFTEVDLRWGLTDEQLALGQVIRACLEEVDRCRPYFIGITGERYGYIPSFLDIQKDPALLEQYPWIEDGAMEGRSITEAEAHYAVLGDDVDVEKCENALFYFRRHRESLEDDGDEDQERERLAEYQERIRRSGARIVSFRDPVSLGEQIYDDLIRIIKRDFADAKPPTPLEEERMRHEGFSLSRRRAYIANPVYLKRLNDHVTSTDEPPLVVYAESGSGKSSLFAWFSHQHRRKHPKDHVIEHYVGIGATATDHYAAINHFCLEVKERFGREEIIPSDPQELEGALGQWLGYAAHELEERDERMVLILDGLNQLQGAAQTLHWLPDEIPSRIRLMLSSTIEETLVELRRRTWGQLGMQALSEPEREAVIVRYLAEYHKALGEEQIRRIAGDHKCGHPLFLKTLLEEIRLVGRHEDLDRRLDEYIGATGTEDLFQRMMERMEEDHGARAVRTALTLLWGTRSGLDERELADITSLSRLKIATLVAGLDYHLMRREGRLRFFHDYLRRAIEKRYLSDESRRTEVHSMLADWFARQEPGSRTSRELIWQLQQTGDEERLIRALSTIDHFIALNQGATEFELHAAWVRLGRVEELDKVYRRGLEEWRTTTDDRSGELEIIGAISMLIEQIGLIDDAIKWQKERLALSIERGDRFQEGRTRGRLGFQLYRCGRLLEAREEFESARVICEETNDIAELGYACGNIGNILTQEGDLDESQKHHELQAKYCDQAGDLVGVGNAIGNIAIIHGLRGEIERAIASYNEKIRIQRSIGNRQGVAVATGNLGINYIRSGELTRAIELLITAVAECRAIGFRNGLTYWLTALSHVIIDLLDSTEEDKTEIPEPIRHLLPAATATDWRALALDRAEEYATETLEISNVQHKLDTLFVSQKFLAIITQMRGRNDEANEQVERLLEELSDSNGPYSSLGDTVREPRIADCYMTLWLFARKGEKDPEKIENLRREALGRFTRLNETSPQEQFRQAIAELEGG